MRLPDFLQFTPEERRAVLAILIFTGGGGILLEVGRHYPAWVPDLLIAAARRSHQAAVDTLRSPAPPARTTAGLILHTGRESTHSAPPARARIRGGPVNLNSADLEALKTLPGIGPRLAARILEDRRLHGPFRSVKDMARVRGIGPATVARLGNLAVAAQP